MIRMFQDYKTSSGLVSGLSSYGEISIHNEISNDKLSNSTNLVIFCLAMGYTNGLSTAPIRFRTNET